MNHFIAGAAQPTIWIADQLEPHGIPRGLVKNVMGGCLFASSLAAIAITEVVSIVACATFPAFAAVTFGGLAAWGLTFGATKVVRFIPGLSEETKESVVSTLNVIKSIAKVIGLNIFLPSIVILQLGIGMITTPTDQFVSFTPPAEGAAH